MTGQVPPQKSETQINFVGRNRADAKRKALNFWFVNQGNLGLTLRAFSERLFLMPDGKTIVFRGGVMR